VNPARAALAKGDLGGCAGIATQRLSVNPRDAEAHFLLGIAMAEGGRIAAALQSVEQAVALDAGNAEYLAQHGRLLSLARREADARAAADRAAVQAAGADAMTIDTIGCVYTRLGDHTAALPLFERAVAAAPDNVDYRFNLASTYGFFDRTAEAEVQYEAIVARDPTHGRAHFGLAGLRRQDADAHHVARLENALAATVDPTDRLRIHYAAAKEYQDLGNPEAAFRHLDTGNRAHKQRIGFTIDADARNARAIRAGFERPGYFAGDSTVEDAPIFVVGMPRTGTTLVDRILSSHPDVRSAGELQAMPLAIKRLAQSPSRLVLDEATIVAAGGLSPDAVGRAYMQRARQHEGAQAGRFVDKLPLNFLYIGYIAQALPNARIVCLRRNPMDSIWSNFKNLFATTSSYYAYSHDLIDTARFYLLFDELIAYWRRRLPGRVLEFGYEALVEDQEGQTRCLLDHVGLPWDAACLNFHANRAPVATPSAAQVRRPLYRDAVQQWRAYAAQLEPVRRFLIEQGVNID
jgi:tetratricopeptide (TPR) repeat protein